MSYEQELKRQSPLEIRFLEDCRIAGLKVEPQYPIGQIHADFSIVDSKIVIECGANIIEPELRPEYIEKLQRLEREKGISFKNIAELRKIIED